MHERELFEARDKTFRKNRDGEMTSRIVAKGTQQIFNPAKEPYKW